MAPTLGRTRLVAQGLITRPYPTPTDAITAFAAMQGQDLPGVLASVALRTPSNCVDDVLAALDNGTVVRGYPMRGTVFLMPAADALWITQLCAKPTIRAAMSRRRELHEGILDRARDLTLALLDGAPRPRSELFGGWEAGGISTAEGRGYHLLFNLIAEGTVCYGPWNGTDQDVALAAQWLPADSGLEARFNGDLDAATAELMRRYFTTHGPATVRDFAWWTKLTLAQIRRGLTLVEGEFETDDADEASYWRTGLLDEVRALRRATAAPLLLPGFDEFILGYRDRLFAMSAEDHQRLVPGNNGVFKRSAVLGGKVVGTWSRAGRPGKRAFQFEPFVELTDAAARRFARLFEQFPFHAG
ncbi:winged helix DNA-binding domain-containing protein [Tessaracoccus massiliensis]|uniref:winged helix DNA-binding domain-containing protein n=1 Tax=Tessaracoccus massiliensis TaxID=1522311 RepID=UPI00058E00D6|nr:winged helix DNA-binding domain-containing protein [Tessaracoccus massiliensis]